MKKIIILLLMIFSFGCTICNSLPEFKVIERCNLSFQFNRCRCHLYDFNKAKRVGAAYDMELEYCNDLVGFKPKDWAEELTPKFKYLIKIIKSNCKK